MAPPPATLADRFTYADVLTWPEDERWELHEGLPVAMSPAPSTAHQRVVGELFRQIANFLVGRPCEVFAAPFDVRLGAANAPPRDIRTVVQPDLTVICDTSGLDERGFQGGPDWVIEVLSPSTSARDQITKLAYYEAYGVRHYWLVHPLDHLVTVYARDDIDRPFPRPAISETKGKLTSGLFPELVIDWELLPSG
ncbi:Uma2 family endonuclease [Paraliomyxa miuraensis]|uniref:Uma2 family endonuclease n=1 Tax=Paraliomyxa miuraensis TaxID=376150 RepID=UPI002255E713|nr:Uma2 family endonuclease [Paraliomyxa miuraensis]MCX4247836.1 Uma2 family endonuclease [Paraliomyxa miuraensis]